MADADPQRRPAVPIGLDEGETITADITGPAVAGAPLADTPPAPAGRKRRWLRWLAILSVPLALAAIGAWLYLSGGRYVETDDAFVGQDKVSVSSDVAGKIVRVAVKENQTVKAGDLLFAIDSDPFRIAVAQADAAIAGAQVNVTTLEASYRGTDADIQAAKDQIASAQESYDRQATLWARGFTTKASLQSAEHSLAQARAVLANAEANAAEAKAKLATGAAVPGENPQIAAAKVQRAKAALDLSRTEVRAPVGGTISQTSRLQLGSYMISGLPAVSIVMNDRSWIDANFKETDLATMCVGQPAEVTFDAYPGVRLKGHIESFGAGTGSTFSVLPAQNATGNWVKVTQRVTVRVSIDQKSSRPLIAGTSAKVSVDTGANGRGC